jgi:ParB/RepB/Spo0J family partition protein
MATNRTEVTKLNHKMSPEEVKNYVTDGGQQMVAVPELEVRQVDPDKIAVDEMNERVDEPLATEDLERSVAENGVVEPPVCRVRDMEARMPYSVVQGQRRVAAAQAVQLDEIPILVGEFEDKEALIRSITENIDASREGVTTKTRAGAIWRLWKMNQGEDCDPVPSPAIISDLLGTPQSTVARWIEPLREQYAETVINPRVNNPTGHTEYDLSNELEDVSPAKLERIRQVASGEKAEELVKKAIREDMTPADVKQAVSKVDKETDAFEAFEEVQREKEIADYVVNKMRFGSDTTRGLKQAARTTGKNRDELIKDAVDYYLREEGFI